MFANLSRTLDSFLQDPSFFQNLEDQFFRANPFQHQASAQKPSVQKSVVRQAINIYQNENKDELAITAEIPGIKKEDISIEVKGDLLQFSTKENQEQKEEQKEQKEDLKVHSSERTSKIVKRSVKLPFLIDQEKVNASYENGVLTIRLLRAEDDKPKKILVN